MSRSASSGPFKAMLSLGDDNEIPLGFKGLGFKGLGFRGVGFRV